ncbi:MAG: hypothetical protein PVF74_12975 [Anaerolineales bacterium]|jgi:hypothetical protein
MHNPRMIVLLVLAMVLLAACGGAPTNTAPVETEVTEVVLPTETEVEQDPTPTEVPTVEPTPTEIPTEVPTEVPIDECLECHQDKDRLIDTAKPEEEVVSESSGEG